MNCKSKIKRTAVFTGGGTAGHVFPGLSVIESMKKVKDLDFYWIGSSHGIEKEIILKHGIKYIGIPSGKLRRYFSFKNFTDIFKILSGIACSIFIMLKFKPAFLFSKGGFVSVPPVFAAHLFGIKVFSHESDFTPGLASRININFSKYLFTSFKDTEKNIFKFKNKIIFTGNPIRSDLLNLKKNFANISKQNDKEIILVLGGSLGAEEVNNLIFKISEKLPDKYTVIHQTGMKNSTKSSFKNYITVDFLGDEYPEYLLKASIVISRAGAATLSEIAFAAKPSILIPLRNFSRGEQVLNAEYFQSQNASILFTPAKNGAEELLLLINEVLKDKERIKSMGSNAFKLSNPDSSDIICSIINKEVFEDNGKHKL